MGTNLRLQHHSMESWARMHHKVVGNFGSEATFEVCTTDVLDSMKLPTSALVLTVDRQSKF